MAMKMYSEVDKGDVRTMKTKGDLSIDRSLECSNTLEDITVQPKRINLYIF